MEGANEPLPGPLQREREEVKWIIVSLKFHGFKVLPLSDLFH
jgi:hypothetical protein